MPEVLPLLPSRGRERGLEVLLQEREAPPALRGPMRTQDFHLCTCPILSYRHLHRERDEAGAVGCEEVCLLCRAGLRSGLVPDSRRTPSKGPRRSSCGFCPRTFHTRMERDAHRNEAHEVF